jgi:hypothetical protein
MDDYQEVRRGLGKDAAKTLFALFVGLPFHHKEKANHRAGERNYATGKAS